MRFKEAFIHTLREDPADAELISHKLMLRAGMIQKVASGIYDYLPLGLRVIRKIEAIIREEMNCRGASELLMPYVVPAELWRESGRWGYYGPELLRIKDRKNNEFCLSPTHEEVVVDVARRGVRSYRDLPLCLYQIQTKFRDEVRPRFGLMRGREFIMKDAYSWHVDEDSLEEMYWRMHEAYTTIFNRCGLDFRPVEADSGNIGGEVTHEFHVLADSGEDTILYCDSCDYAANIEKAATRDVPAASIAPADAPAPEEVETPGKKSIDDVSSFLGISPADTVKMVVYDVNEGEYLAAACIRGDREVNEAKLRTALGANSIGIPEDDALTSKTDLAVGFLGAYNVERKELKAIVADSSVQAMSDCVCGANKTDAHVRHIFPDRDLTIDKYVDIGFVHQGQGCPRCDKGSLKQCRGIEVGQVFKLGAKYSEPMGMTFLDDKGEARNVTMGCYGIGVGRTAAASIEQNHDKDGIIWPTSIAPFGVTVLCLDPGTEEAMSLAMRFHDELQSKGIDVLVDDRDERPGVKFKDADLVGCPIRLVIGSRGLKDGVVEVKTRRDGNVQKVPVANTVARVVELFGNLKGATAG